MHHLLAFTATVAQTANTDIAALTDDVINIQNSHFLPNMDLMLLWAQVRSPQLNRARLVTPTLRQITLPFIRPIRRDVTTDPTGGATVDAEARTAINAILDDLVNREPADYRNSPFRLPRLEEISLEATSDLASGSERVYGLLGVTAGFEPAPSGNIFTMRGTSTTASVANTWTTLATTWADNLPEGRYSVVGLNVVGATEVAARLIFENQIWRPGAIAGISEFTRIPKMFSKGRLGNYGIFNSWAVPQVQVLNSGAVSSHTTYLDLVRVG